MVYFLNEKTWFARENVFLIRMIVTFIRVTVTNRASKIIEKGLFHLNKPIDFMINRKEIYSHRLELFHSLHFLSYSITELVNQRKHFVFQKKIHTQALIVSSSEEKSKNAPLT